jgi:heptosyltransferase II
MKILLIQTAFIGDVILATPIIEAIKAKLPDAQVDVLVRKGNQTLFDGHPHVQNILIWDKGGRKYANLCQVLSQVRRIRYDWVINCQRFAASGFLTAFSKAKQTAGFRKNPFSLLFTHRIAHKIGNGLHETQRNLSLLKPLLGYVPDNNRPQLYPAPTDVEKAKNMTAGYHRYVCIAPTSVWFTKQWPMHKWIALIERLPAECAVFLLGAKGDAGLCEAIRIALPDRPIHNAAGQLSFLASAALIQGAVMTYVNDSAPLHLASAVDAPVTAVFCATVPAFGFGPSGNKGTIVETTESLACRPCGLHGRKACPKGHFACAEGIMVEQMLSIA